MNDHDCNCADSPPETAPQSVVNPAGADSVTGRVGTHASFLAEMKRRLSSRDYPHLARLRTRLASDPSIALLDAWATAGDVLTFYNERIVNESYLRTATEHRSLAELAYLIGYQPGPGVAASVFLAFTLEKDAKQAAAETLIPKGTAAKSVPGDGETPQTFETSEDLRARPEWNAIKPRMGFPQDLTQGKLKQANYLYLSGLHPKIKPSDRLLVFLRERQPPEDPPLTITEVFLDKQASRTRLSLRENPLSRAALYRDTKRAADAFDGAIPKPPSPTLSSANAAITELLHGNGATISELATTTALADVNTRIGKVIATILGDGGANPALKPKETLTELDPSTAPPPASYLSVESQVRQIVETNIRAGSDSWINKLERDFADLVAFQSVDDKLEEVAANFDPNYPTSASVASAKSAVVPIVQMLPTSTTFPKHKQNAQDVIDAINGLDPTNLTTISNYKTKLAALNRWWHGASTGPNQANAIAKLATVVDDLLQKVQRAAFPYVELAEAKQIAHDAITTAMTDLPNSEVKQRLMEVQEAFDGAINLHDNAVKLEPIRTNVTFPPAGVTPLVDDVLAGFTQLKNSWDLAAEMTDLDKHKKATDTAHELADLISAYKDVAQSMIRDVVPSLTGDLHSLADVIKRRRDEFLKAFDAISTAFSDLSHDVTTNGQSAAQILNDLKTKLHLADSLQVAADLMLKNPRATPAGAIAELRKITEPIETALGQRIAALIEQLQNLWQVIAEPGNSTLIVSGGGTFETGGIVSIFGSGNASRASEHPSRIRQPDDALQIVSNAAADVIPQLVSAMHLQDNNELLVAWRQLQVPYQPPRVSLIGGTASLFGYNAPRPLFDKNFKIIAPPGTSQEWTLTSNAVDCVGKVYLAQELSALPDWGTIILRYADGKEQPSDYSAAKSVARSDFGLNAKTTELTLVSGQDWREPPGNTSFGWLRTTLVLHETETFELADVPIDQPIGGKLPPGTQGIDGFDPETDQIEFDNLYLGIVPGHKIVVSGELSNSPGVFRSELATVNNVQHMLRLVPGDTAHTRVFLARALTNTYKRDTVTLYANVVNATHGETVRQVIGSGDASVPFQKFALAKFPLTYLAAPTASGVASTLEVRVNNLRWHEQDSLLDSAANARDFVVQADNDWHSSVQFGDGVTGARLPTGRENVRAIYRTGLGLAGNVKANAVSQLAHRPLGVKEVINPLPASGGADPESVAQIRANAPLAVMALDRLVSVRDYADFAQNYAAIDKAAARGLLIYGQPTVHVTIAGAGDLPIADDSDLFQNLLAAYRDLGDPLQAVNVQVRELKILFVSAGVRLLPDYEWVAVEPAIREALYSEFSFARRALAQDVYLSEVQASIQKVDGVEYVDVDVFAGLSEGDFTKALNQSASQTNGDDTLPKLLKSLLGEPGPVITVADIRLEQDDLGHLVIRTAQLAYLSLDVPDSLFLKEITS
jgi:hypothetical protein